MEYAEKQVNLQQIRNNQSDCFDGHRAALSPHGDLFGPRNRAAKNKPIKHAGYAAIQKRHCERSEANGTLAKLPQPAPDLSYLKGPHYDWALRLEKARLFNALFPRQ